MVRTAARWMLVLAAAGAAHLVRTRGFRIVVPEWAPRITRLDKDTIIVASGAVGLTAGERLT